jgi:hypothetical protein
MQPRPGAGSGTGVWNAGPMPLPLRRALALLLSLAGLPVAAGAAADSGLRAKMLSAYDGVKSYRLEVLGSVRSSGVFVAPDRYSMTTVFEGKAVKSIFIGSSYWIQSGGKWQKADQPSDNLYVDISGLLRNARKNPATPFVVKPPVVRNGKKVGEFTYTFKNGTEETCDYDLQTYLAERCKAEELTILYSAYNAPGNAVLPPH